MMYVVLVVLKVKILEDKREIKEGTEGSIILDREIERERDVHFFFLFCFF